MRWVPRLPRGHKAHSKVSHASQRPAKPAPGGTGPRFALGALRGALVVLLVVLIGEHLESHHAPAKVTKTYALTGPLPTVTVTIPPTTLAPRTFAAVATKVTPTTVPVWVDPPFPTTTTTTQPAQVPTLEAQALSLVRYPWQRIPCYSIQFQPVPGIDGTVWTVDNCATSTIYVSPGEATNDLAGQITYQIAQAFDVDYVGPAGHGAIEGFLGLYSTGWSSLSAWFDQAFADYWSPGVPAQAEIVPAPTGQILADLVPWMSPQPIIPHPKGAS